jgi:putative transposase
MKSTNMLERLSQEIKRRTHVVRIFPNSRSCLRLVLALAVETHEDWLETARYLNMDHTCASTKSSRCGWRHDGARPV